MKVSVVVPAYNHEKYVAEAIDSVLSQTHEDFELIIVNDGSKDKTEDVVLSFRDSRIKYFSQNNHGAHAAISRGIEMSSGEYVAILNSDDVYCPDRLALCVEFLDANPNYSAVLTRVVGINGISLPVSKQDSTHIRAWLDWYEKAFPLFQNDQFMPNAFSKNILITTSNYFVRKNTLNKIGDFRPLRYAHDWDMLLRLAGESNIHLMDSVLLKYRIHESNTVQEENSEARVRFEVNWLIAENLEYLLSSSEDVPDILSLLAENHYVSIKVLMLILAYRKSTESLTILNFNGPVTKGLVNLLS